MNLRICSPAVLDYPNGLVPNLCVQEGKPNNLSNLDLSGSMERESTKICLSQFNPV